MSIPPAGGAVILLGAATLAACGESDDTALCVIPDGQGGYSVVDNMRCDDDSDGGSVIFVNGGGHYRSGQKIHAKPGKTIRVYKPSSARASGRVSSSFGKSGGFGSTAKGGSSGGGSKGSGS